MQDDEIQTRQRAVATLRDVSRLAGVGMSTVSRVLRNHGSFSDETRGRVVAAVEALGYVPNRIAGSLASAGSGLVGIVIPSLHNIVFPDLLSGVSRSLDAAGRQPVIGVTDYDIDREEALVRSMLAWRPAALLVVGLEHTPRTTAMLQGAGIRVAELFDTDGEGIDFVVGFSQRAAGALSARHLLSRGYRSIAYIGPAFSTDPRSSKRYEGFRDELRKSGLDFVDRQFIEQTSSTEAGRAALAAIRARGGALDAVYFSNDDFAVGGLFHCIAEGVEVPGRLAIMGYNGLDIGRFAPLPLTTVQTPRAEVGEIGARLVMEGGPARRVDVPFELIEGATA